MSDLRPRLALRDLVEEALASLTARPGRAVLTALGTVLGVAALVATLGLSKTAGNQIVGRFDALAATDIVVTPKAAGAGRAGGGSVLPWDAEARAARLNGVVAAGTLSDVDLRRRPDPVGPGQRPGGPDGVPAAGEGGVARACGRRSGPAWPPGGSPTPATPPGPTGWRVVGANVAEQLHVTRIEDQPAIFLGDKPLHRGRGHLRAVSRQASLLGSVVIPEGTADRDFGLGAPGSVQVETRIGAANLIAGQLPLALSPTDPALSRSTAPPEPRRVRAGVQSDLNTLFLLLGGRLAAHRRQSGSPTSRWCRCSSGSARSACAAPSAPPAATSPASSCWRARRSGCSAGCWAPPSARWSSSAWPPAAPGRRSSNPGCPSVRRCSAGPSASCPASTPRCGRRPWSRWRPSAPRCEAGGGLSFLRDVCR